MQQLLFDLHFFRRTLIKLFYTPNFSSIMHNWKYQNINWQHILQYPTISWTKHYSDHLPQVLLVPGFYGYKNAHKSNLFIHDWKTFNIATFSADYKYTDWPTIMQIDKGNPNFSFHNLIEEAEKVISNHTPLRKTRKRVYSD